ncbi:Uncharacterized conserved protein YdiU, UPF0061 family [Desulfocicer vacuolatum DSM 3385]|uniref:Protein nucleotidyltransferase YdiU n=1 Tax=Desulfocicer vacuolatum DSM 3385 TaxID=1121400 RepID=A0A1W2BHW0_9BACT|nr:YdiU family protein [Desulfocicer vacuolatum]SMC72494.1 Uncharacterized conserved protein YdiU, UPF0061 family [Desulfocicer vacuolatum DSM 3385]
MNTLTFDNSFVRELPGDALTHRQPRRVTGACYSRVPPVSVSVPGLVVHSREAAALIGLSESDCLTPQFTRVFSGNEQLLGMDPFAMCYGGHQFGNWVGQLGDGRAINLGEVINRQGHRWVLQLKGAGLTPYSRTADGLAVLRSSIREFLCSEAMFHLGVPTTRALSLVTTGEQVVRDMFYDGHPKEEPGAVVCRMAPSFIRFGNFQILAVRNELALLQQLVDYTIKTDFPHLGIPSKETYLQWIRQVCRTTAEMVIHWMRVGFVHGVMNTDNMSILGLTIDYGPYGWLENYDPAWTPNTTDASGRRYCFGNQSGIAHWNLVQLANAIYPLIGEVEPLQESMDVYVDVYTHGWQQMMARKLGFEKYEKETDEDLISDLLDLLPLVETDMTLFFRNLAVVNIPDGAEFSGRDDTSMAPLMEAYYTPEELTPAYKEKMIAWLKRYGVRLTKDGIPSDKRREAMNRVNPKYVLRNYLAQLAIDKAEAGEHGMVKELLEVMRHPYDEQPEKEHFAEKRPEWARNRAGCSMLSCSS